MTKLYTVENGVVKFIKTKPNKQDIKDEQKDMSAEEKQADNRVRKLLEITPYHLR